MHIPPLYLALLFLLNFFINSLRILHKVLIIFTHFLTLFFLHMCMYMRQGLSYVALVGLRCSLPSHFIFVYLLFKVESHIDQANLSLTV